MSGDRLRCIPYFHILGVSKCGTTDLYHRLSKHPQMLESRNKVRNRPHRAVPHRTVIRCRSATLQAATSEGHGQPVVTGHQPTARN